MRRNTYLDKNGTAESRFKMNHASETSVGLRKTNGATLTLPFLLLCALCTVVEVEDEGRPSFLSAKKVAAETPDSGALPSAGSTEQLGVYIPSNRIVPAVPVGATFRPESGGIAAV